MWLALGLVVSVGALVAVAYLWGRAIGRDEGAQNMAVVVQAAIEQGMAEEEAARVARRKEALLAAQARAKAAHQEALSQEQADQLLEEAREWERSGS